MTLPPRLNVPSPLAAAVSLTLSLMAAAPCAAQDAQAAAAPAAPASAASTASGRSAEVQSVTVTAQKRSEREQDVPMSMEVIDATNMAAQGQVKLSDFFDEIPGLGYFQNSMSSAITLRGVGTDAGLGIRPTTGVTIDDVPYGSATNTGVMPDLDPSDLQRIEVLRGPQGALYGASSMGGLLKYVTVDPETCCVSGRVEVTGSDVEHGAAGYGARASVNVPLSSSFALRASVFKRKDPGWVKNIEDGRENTNFADGGRVSALWKVTNKVTVRAAAMVQDTTQDGSATVDSDKNLQPLDGEYRHDRIAGADTFKGQMHFYTAKLTADLDWATLDAISGYSQHRSSALQDVSYTTIGQYAPTFSNLFGFDASNPGALIDNRYNENKFSQEVRLSSNGDQRWRWQVGAFYTKEASTGVQNFYLADKPTGAVYTDVPLLISQDTGSYKERAVFGDTSYRFTDRFDVQIGGRFAKNWLQDTSHTGGALTDEDTTSDSSGDKVFTYLFSPRYKLGENAMTYARVASGYRAGGSSGAILANVSNTFKSDKLVSYEFGLKSQLLDRRLGFDVAVFRINWKDLQVSQINPVDGTSYTTNAGRATSQGLELSANYVPTPDWKLTASYALTDAKLAEDIPGYVEGSSAYGKSGDRLPFTARNGGTVSATRYMGLDGGLQAFFGGNANYVGSRDMQFTESESLARIHVPSYTTVGLNAGVQSQQWSLTLFVRNLTDKKGIINASRRASSTTADDSSTVYGATVIQPRTVGVTLSWDY